jgi:ribose-phosphate pyrophosphokinase
MLEVVGEVRGRTCVLVDDIIATGGTICSAADLLVQRGATRVWAVATHGVFAGPAIGRLQQAPFDRIVVTNTLPVPDACRFDSLVILSVAPMIADAIKAIFHETSVSEISDGLGERF